MKTLALWKTKNKHWWNKLDFFTSPPTVMVQWKYTLFFKGTHLWRNPFSTEPWLWEETYLFTNLPLQFPHDFHNDFPKVSYETFPAGISWKGRRHWKQWCGRRLWRLATPKPFMTGQYKLGHETSNSRWFNVTFLSPSWRSRNLQKGHLTIPKRSINNGIIIVLISLVATHICFIFHPIPEEMIQYGHVGTTK